MAFLLVKIFIHLLFKFEERYPILLPFGLKYDINVKSGQADKKL